MKISKNIVSILVLALTIAAATAQAQPQSSRATDRQAAAILQRIEQTSSKFQSSLNTALALRRGDQTRVSNDINRYQTDFVNATSQYRDQLTRRRATATDVQQILSTALLINGFVATNRMNQRVQADWTSVRTNLDALANVYGVAWQWHQQTPVWASPNRSHLSDTELSRLILRIDTGGDTFRTSLTEAFGETRYDRTTRERDMNEVLRGFKSATEQLRNQLDARRPVAEYVERVLVRAAPIQTFMQNNPLTNRAQNDWSTLRGDLNTLASAYNLASNLSNSDEPPVRYTANSRLTGTFKLDVASSDNPRTVAQQATRTVTRNERQRISDGVLARLESPEMLAIERRGSTITLASSKARRQTFDADGVEHQEPLSTGGSTRTTATLSEDQLSIISTGSRDNDFKVTFEAIENGNRLRVTREIYAERRNQPIVVNSFYDRTSVAAQWAIYNNSTPIAGNPNSGDFIVGDGETVVAVLNNGLTSNETKVGDRFTLTVREPGQYEGAVIEGTVASVDQGGRLTGRSGLSLNFNTISLRNGRSYTFAGVLSNVRTPQGDTVKVDNEGSTQGNDQTKQTIQRGGIGTAIGAIVGAIAGGAKGAVIGAVVGAAGGAGSVYVQGKDKFELPTGTELTIRASAPR